MTKDSLTLCRALGYDLNTVEFAVEDGVPYAIDFMNPAPDADRVRSATRTSPGSSRRWPGSPIKKAQEPRDAARPALGADAQGPPMRPSFTIGIEEEYQTIDPETFDLRSHIQTELMAQGKRVLNEKVKPEMHQSVVEVGTGVCRDIREARADMRRPAPPDAGRSPTRTACCWSPGPPIPSPTGGCRTSPPTSATCRSSRTCSRWPGPT